MHVDDDETIHATILEHEMTDKLILYKASKIVNRLLQEESKRLSKDESLLYFNVDTYLDNINSLLVQFLTSAVSTR